MAVGESKEIVVKAADGYGEYDAKAILRLPRAAFPADMEMEPGIQIHVLDAATGDICDASLAEVRLNTVLLDFNHPLAGKELAFHVLVTALRQATPEELAGRYGG
jgi:FKBP-type peptidyl-prolyl cis-trans isomerase SlyD